MNLSEFIKQYRKTNKLTMQELADKASLSKGYISMLENNTNYKNSNKMIVPSIEVLKKLAIAMNITLDSLVNAVDCEVSLTGEDIIIDNTQKNENMFSSAQEAFEYIIKQPTVAMYGGYDLEKMSDEELIEFANDLADMIAIVSKKYKK